MKPVTEFENMAELRCEIDALDGQIVAQLVRRAALIARAAELKPKEGLPARIQSRVDEVIKNVRIKAENQGLDPALVETLWREMIEWSILEEEKTLGVSPIQPPDIPEETGL
ncbi:chorismate mutase [Profundibacter sp.]